jgi:hypothetical protein
MRQSYKSRTAFHMHLFRPLSLLSIAYRNLGELDKAVIVLREIADGASFTPPLCYTGCPDVHFHLAQYYTLLGNRPMSKKVDHFYNLNFLIKLINVGNQICYVQYDFKFLLFFLAIKVNLF